MRQASGEMLTDKETANNNLKTNYYFFLLVEQKSWVDELAEGTVIPTLLFLVELPRTPPHRSMENWRWIDGDLMGHVNFMGFSAHPR